MVSRICFLFFMQISVAGFSKDAGDSLWSRNSVRIDVFGKTFGGVGIVFERNLVKKHPERHPMAFTSVEVGISDPLLFDLNIMPGLGASRNWYLFKHKRFIADAGIYLAVKIDLEPTKKEIRDSYKGWSGVPLYIRYPFVTYLISDIGIKMLFEKWFIKLSLNPMIYYEQIYAHRLSVLPWGGIGIGFF
ncbi:hypothetical protein BH11BAC7_BH11BAC7_23260 [soil metagenome]